MTTDTNSPAVCGSSGEPACGASPERHGGLLVVNADDWGRDQKTTDQTLDCVVRGAVSSVSAMVFMVDSERAAAIAQERTIDAGLHLNFTTGFSAPRGPAQLIEHQRRITQYLRGRRVAQAVFHPGLMRSFDYVTLAQVDEFRRLYQRNPGRVDGHHHMHLCANVLWGGLLPAGTIARRNFSFQPGEKSFGNRVYRQVTDCILARRHQVTDYFFSLPPLAPLSRLQRIFSLAQQFVVEVETHPVNPEEYRFLAGGDIVNCAGDIRIAPRFSAPRFA